MRSWVGVLFGLVLCLHGTDADATLTQPNSISASPGETIKISCTMSGGSISDWYCSWYWQRPGGVPRLVWSESNGRPSEIPDRFDGSVDGSSNKMHLTITGAQPEDAIDYYCFAARTFGKGTKLNLGMSQPPVVSVLRPSAVEIATKDTATLVCLVSGFIPGALDIEWTVDGSEVRNGAATSPVQQETDNTFSASSYLTLSASDWNSHELYSCVVKHETLANPMKTNIAKSSCI
ncbi:immunoglobulin lambda-1 light chain-like [Narcine bancroftii]|uniref:immunoglobulin lambda-1 light chain-like n=1 Tax=Narcine bancroftii TaxID=1343680 RepID=UPI0038317BC6